jgi:hypothetical protein
MTAEHERLAEARLGSQPWKKWGPYLSERQWETAREVCESPKIRGVMVPTANE